jgi:hypothetical protein
MGYDLGKRHETKKNQKSSLPKLCHQRTYIKRHLGWVGNHLGFSKLPNSSIRLKEALKNPSHDPWSPDAAMALSCLRRGNAGSSEPP